MTTPRLGAPELVSGQAIPETTVDEQIRYIESGAGHFIFKSRAVAAPPGSPADGDCYLVAASPTGAWTGQAGKIVFRINTAWAFITPIEGFTAWIDDEDVFVGFDGAAWNTLAAPSGVYVPLSYLDTDGTLAANSDTKIASQKAVRTYVASKLVGMFDLRGTTDCSANPNYPAASKGDAYVVTVAGKIGGASGISVSIGDVYFATADNAGGTQAGVGASWDQVIHSGSLSGALLAALNLSDVNSPVAAKDNISKQSANIASAGTTDLSTATGDLVTVTGTTTITSFGTCAAGVERTVKFAGALTLTYNASSLILPTSANITTAAGDTAVFRSLGSGNWLCIGYQTASGAALAGGTSLASSSDVQAGTSTTKAVTPAALAGSAAPQTLVDGATISWDMSLGFNAKVTLGGARTLATPTNPVAGQTYSLGVAQDGTGSRTMTWPASFDWGTTGAPTLTTAASKVDRVTLFCTDAATPKFEAFLSAKGFAS